MAVENKFEHVELKVADANKMAATLADINEASKKWKSLTEAMQMAKADLEGILRQQAETISAMKEAHAELKVAVADLGIQALHAVTRVDAVSERLKPFERIAKSVQSMDTRLKSIERTSVQKHKENKEAIETVVDELKVLLEIIPENLRTQAPNAWGASPQNEDQGLDELMGVVPLLKEIRDAVADKGEKVSKAQRKAKNPSRGQQQQAAAANHSVDDVGDEVTSRQRKSNRLRGQNPNA